jgi:4-amino-4-deoxy-L-arabinose transferase-like glycosyltransferase
MFQRFSHLPWLSGILLVAFTLRVGAAVWVQQRVDRTGSLCLIAGDAEGYWMLARHLVRGEDFAIYDPPRYVERMPGFPVLLALSLKVFGTSALAARLVLAGVGTGACGLVYYLGRELAGRRTGLIASGIAAVSPTFIVFSVLLLSETLFAATLLASLLALAFLVRSGEHVRKASFEKLDRPWLAVVAGVLCGLATLVRPTWILVAPAFVVLYLLESRLSLRRVLHAGLLLAGLVATMAPWTVRNYYVTGHIVPTTLWLGPSLYDGLSPGATGDSNMEFVERDGRYARRDLPDFEYQANAYYRRAALAFAWRNPPRAIELGIYKLWRYANPFPNADQFSQPAVWWGVGLFEFPVLLLAGVGAWRWRTAKWRLVLTVGPVLYFAAIHAVFVGSVRYRLPAEYALLVVTAVGLNWLVERWGRFTP